MTDAQKAEKAAGDARKELRALAVKEDSTSEDIEKATKELNDLETRAEALSASEPAAEPVPTEDSEARELRSPHRQDKRREYLRGRGEPPGCGRAGEGAARAFRDRLKRDPAVAPGGAGRRDGSGLDRKHYGPDCSPGIRER